MKKKIIGVIIVIAIALMYTGKSSADLPILLSEDFEDGTLDSMITIGTVGTFNSLPGIMSFSSFGSINAFGFGLSTNRFNSFDNYVTNFTISFDNPTAVHSVKFKEMEVFDNWGSNGQIIADGNLISDWFGFGRMPYNDRQADSTFRNRDFIINDTVSQIQVRVNDITDLSEIRIDDLVITAAPEPVSSTLFIIGGAVMSFRMFRKKITEA